MSALIAAFLQYLPDLVKAAESVPGVVTYIQKMYANFKQTKEWTAVEQSDYDAKVERVTSQVWWTEAIPD